jgi:hypothetical protein
MTTTKLTNKQVKEACKALGIAARWNSDVREWKIAGSYFTDDNQDAVDTAKHIATRKAIAMSC